MVTLGAVAASGVSMAGAGAQARQEKTRLRISATVTFLIIEKGSFIITRLSHNNLTIRRSKVKETQSTDGL
jgi:hypothetical protein